MQRFTVIELKTNNYYMKRHFSGPLVSGPIRPTYQGTKKMDLRAFLGKPNVSNRSIRFDEGKVQMKRQYNNMSPLNFQQNEKNVSLNLSVRYRCLYLWWCCMNLLLHRVIRLLRLIVGVEPVLRWNQCRGGTRVLVNLVLG